MALSDRFTLARVYDYLLGGSHNFAADRRAAETAIRVAPDLSRYAHINRAFLRRTVTFMIEHGVTQFLDIGAGIPALGATHEVAQHLHREATVVYVDSDPAVIAQGTAMLTGHPLCTAVLADARFPQALVMHPSIRDSLNWQQPLGVLLLGVLNLIAEDDTIAALLTALQAALPLGSYLAISHAVSDSQSTTPSEALRQLVSSAHYVLRVRTVAEVQLFFDGFDLVYPGLVPAPQWRPETEHDLGLEQPEARSLVAGVGVKE
ncbi:MAG: SAM-dependent methyltransferase [Chloroflexi bacterium]|nr:SAM-dependent methyltransferase [Chloroflexota bacterium]